MRRWSRWIDRDDEVEVDPDDRGSAALEFILVGFILLVPVVYLIVSLGLIQGQSLGIEAGARHIARTVAQSPDAATAESRAERVLAAVIEEYGIDPDAVEFSFSCHGSTGSCPDAGATLIVTLATRVSLPLVPPVLGLDRLASVPVQSSSAQKVSRFWGSE